MNNKLLLLTIAFAITTQIILAQIPSNIPRNGLVGYWPFNGNAKDESGNGNDGKVNGATLTTDRFGIPNKAYNFDGSAWIELNQLTEINNSNQLAVSIWVSSTGFNTHTNCNSGCVQFYFSRGYDSGNGFGLATFQGDNPHFFGSINGPFAGGKDVNSTIKIDIPHVQWHHLLMNYNGETIKYYVNGVLSGTTPYTENIGIGKTSKAVFGRQFVPNYPYYVIGMIDDAAIWNRALTEVEISDVFSENSNKITKTNAPKSANDLNSEHLKYNSDLTSKDVEDKKIQKTENPIDYKSLNLKEIISDNGCIVLTNYPEVISVSWSGTCKDSLANGSGILKYHYSNGAVETYEGEIQNGFRNGYGSILYLDGTNYEGDWLNNQKNGYGTYTWKNGDVYFGEWKDGKENGNGALKYSNGTEYDGEWIDGMLNGKGTMTFSNGEKYVGQLSENKKNGFGTQNYTDGSIYEGEWRDNIFSGKGTMTYSNGEKYVGQFRDNKKNGQGTQTYLKGFKYVGEWKDDIRDGKGTFFWEDGDRFDGDFKNNLRNGFGIKNYSNGDRYEGNWKDDLRNGVGIYTWSDGDIFEGDWKDDRRNGFGTLTYSDGRKYAGGWENDKKNGFGISSKSNGSKAEGLWVDDTQVGRWIATSQNGDKYSFEWKNGEIVSGSEKKLNNGKEDVKKIWDDALNNMKGGLNGGWIKNPKKCQNCKGKGVVPVCKICEKRGKILCKTCNGKKILYNGTVCIKCLGTGIQTCNSCRGKIYNIKCQHTIWQFQR